MIGPIRGMSRDAPGVDSSRAAPSSSRRSSPSAPLAAPVNGDPAAAAFELAAADLRQSHAEPRAIAPLVRIRELEPTLTDLSRPAAAYRAIADDPRAHPEVRALARWFLAVGRGVARQAGPGRGRARAARVPSRLVDRRTLRQRGAERTRARVPARGRARPRGSLSGQGARGGLAPAAARAGVPRHPRHRHGRAAAAGGGGLRAGRARGGPPAAGPALDRRQRRRFASG